MILRIQTEGELIGVAAALAGATALSPAEQALVDSAPSVSELLVAHTREAIAAGGDPLGAAFSTLRSPAERRTLGAVYTPAAIIDSMLSWAAEQGQPARIVDPGAGSGRYLLAAATRFPQAELVGIELDPVAALMLRANLAVQDLANRAKVIVADYRSAEVAPIDGATLFIGNPPYVRHHAIGEQWKRWYVDAAAQHGIKASALAGLHVHFFFRTLQLARPGDFGAFITSAEWLDVNYGSALRRLLTEQLGGVALHVLDAAAMPFADAFTTGAIACFRVGTQPVALRVRAVPTLDELNGLSCGRDVPRAEVIAARKWSPLITPTAAMPADYIELGELFRVSRGQVTGSNDVWIAGAEARDLPDSVLAPTVTKARELLAAGEAITNHDPLRRVVDLPADLDEIDPEHRPAVSRFLRWAKRNGAADGYVARHRRAWWAVDLYAPAPILCTYMARRAPAFVRNLCGARHLNIAHGLYPRQQLTDAQLSGLLAYLRQHVGTAGGRTYAGGLTKFEPGEMERIKVPNIGELATMGAAA